MKKKKILFIMLFAFIAIFCLKTNVYADVKCEALPNVQIDDSIPNVVSIIIKVIQIAVPVILVVFGSMDLIKGVTSQKEDEIKKGQQILIKRLIAGVLVFFVIAIVKFIIGAVASDDNQVMQCACHFFYGANNAECLNK